MSVIITAGKYKGRVAEVVNGNGMILEVIIRKDSKANLPEVATEIFRDRVKNNPHCDYCGKLIPANNNHGDECDSCVEEQSELLHRHMDQAILPYQVKES